MMRKPFWHILLIDDDEDDFVLTRELLREAKGHDFALEWASGSQAGLQMLLAKSWDAVLVDYDLGGSDGLSLIRQAARQGCKAPMIVVTGRGSYEKDVEAMQAGAADYISKSQINAPFLERVIRYAIGRRHAEEELEHRVSERTEELQAEVVGRRRVEAELRQANELLERVFSGIHLMLAYMDRDFNFIRVNEAFAAAGQLTPASMVGKNHFTLYPNEENRAIFQRVIDTGQPFVSLARPFVHPRQPERSVTYWDWSLQPVYRSQGQVSGLVLSLVDVTSRKQAELALREKEAFLSSVVGDAPLVLWATDRHGTVTLLEGNILVKWGFDPQLAIGRRLADLLEGHSALLQPVEKALAGEENHQIFPHVHIGEMHDEALQIRCSPMVDENGELNGVIGVAQIITPLVRSQEKLEYQAYLLDNVHDAILASDEHFILTAWNKAAERVYGYKAEEVMGKPGSEIVPAQFIHMPAEEARHKLAEDGRFEGELIQHRKDGQPVWIDSKTVGLRDESGCIRTYVSVNRDISQRKQMEAALLHQQEQAGLLDELSRHLSRAFPQVEKMMSDVARLAGQRIGAYCVLGLLSSDNGTIEPGQFYHPDSKTVDALQALLLENPFRMDEGATGRAVAENRITLLDNLSDPAQRNEIGPAYRDLVDHLDVGSLLIVPFSDQLKVIGVLVLARASAQDPFSLEEQAFMQKFTGLLGLMLANARLYHRTQSGLAAQRPPE